MQDSSYIQQNQDKTPQNNTIETVISIHINSIHFNENSRSRSCKKGITLDRGSVLWRTLDVACHTYFRSQSQKKSFK